jgi:membrane associated rhomboid family serine protease
MDERTPEPPESPEPETDMLEPEDPGYIPPDPDEPPPVELWSVVGDVLPWGTMLLLLSWAAMFALLAIRREIGDTAAYAAFGASIAQRGMLAGSWRLLASTFLHGGVAHVFFNATSMLIFGPTVERIFTRWGFWIVYAFGGAAASLASIAWRLARHGAGPSMSVGASGAIFALGGALLVGAWRLRHRLAVGRARAMGAALLFLIVQSLAAGLTEHGTDNAAHAGGLLAGALLAGVVPLNVRLGGAPAGFPVRFFGALGLLALAASLAMGIHGGLAGPR